MNNTGPNPKFIYQGIIFIGSLIIFTVLIFILKKYTGKSIAVLLKEYQRLFSISLLFVFILFVFAFLVLYAINN